MEIKFLAISSVDSVLKMCSLLRKEATGYFSKRKYSDVLSAVAFVVMNVYDSELDGDGYDIKTMKKENLLTVRFLIASGILMKSRNNMKTEVDLVLINHVEDRLLSSLQAHTKRLTTRGLDVEKLLADLPGFFSQVRATLPETHN